MTTEQKLAELVKGMDQLSPGEGKKIVEEGLAWFLEQCLAMLPPPYDLETVYTLLVEVVYEVMVYQKNVLQPMTTHEDICNRIFSLFIQRWNLVNSGRKGVPLEIVH
jgi:hypothetical protein